MPSGEDMGQEVRDQEILRRLAIVDEGLASEQAGLGRAPPGAWVLDPAAAALVRVEAPAAVGTPEACLD